jgi:hypothetical protein
MADAEVRRSLEAIWIEQDDDGRPILTCLCDCSHVTGVTLVLPDLDEHPGAAADMLPSFSYTCDGCGTSHWFDLSVEADA